MDWITFIKWNGIAYSSYYGVNLLVDFMLLRKKQSPKTAFKSYQLPKSEPEEPQAVNSTDFLYKKKKEANSETESNPAKAKNKPVENAIGFNAPIERQGVPVDEYMKHAVKQGNKIYNQN